MGLLGAPLDGFATNGQVISRIHPKLIDLIAALATGTVGAFALVRSDISDTLPGVAIAISLVPPLAVVGLLLSVQRYSDAAGAALLFGTNVAAIIATGAAVFLGYRIRQVALEGGHPVGHLRGRSLVVVAQPGRPRGHPAHGGQHPGRHGPAARVEGPAGRRGVGQSEPLARHDAERHRLATSSSPRSDPRPTPTPPTCAPSSTTRA